MTNHAIEITKDTVRVGREVRSAAAHHFITGYIFRDGEVVTPGQWLTTPVDMAAHLAKVRHWHQLQALRRRAPKSAVAAACLRSWDWRVIEDDDAYTVPIWMRLTVKLARRSGIMGSAYLMLATDEPRPGSCLMVGCVVL